MLLLSSSSAVYLFVSTATVYSRGICGAREEQTMHDESCVPGHDAMKIFHASCLWHLRDALSIADAADEFAGKKYASN